MNSLIVVNEMLPAVPQSSEDRKAEILERASLVNIVKNATTQQMAVGVLLDLKTLEKEVEKARVAVKEPFLRLCQDIDATAKNFIAEPKAEIQRIERAVNLFQVEEENKRRQAEADRQAEIQRIAAEEREAKAKIERENQLKEIEARQKQIALEQEAARIEAARVAECKRLEVEAAKVKSGEETKRLCEEAKANAEKARLEQQRIAQEQAKIDAEQAEYRANAERLALEHAENEARRKAALPVVVAPVQAAGQKSKAEWDYEIYDIHALYRENPGMVTLSENKSEIKAAIKNGVRKLDGVRIFERMKTNVKPVSQRQLSGIIEV